MCEEGHWAYPRRSASCPTAIPPDWGDRKVAWPRCRSQQRA